MHDDRNDLSTGERLLREEQCREMTGLSRATRFRMELRGEFPRRRRLTSRVCGWLESEVVDWLRGRPAGGADAPSSALRALAESRKAA